MSIAAQVATRATCDRKHVGALIVRDRFVLSTGYNGSIPGLDHCDDTGHMMEQGHCVRTIHAEANAICQAARNGVAIAGATLYVTSSPCFSCFKLCASAGIVTIVYGEFYRDQRIFDLARQACIDLRHVELSSSPATVAGVNAGPDMPTVTGEWSPKHSSNPHEEP